VPSPEIFNILMNRNSLDERRVLDAESVVHQSRVPSARGRVKKLRHPGEDILASGGNWLSAPVSRKPRVKPQVNGGAIANPFDDSHVQQVNTFENASPGI
jgi:hypothetical protein